METQPEAWLAESTLSCAYPGWPMPQSQPAGLTHHELLGPLPLYTQAAGGRDQKLTKKLMLSQGTALQIPMFQMRKWRLRRLHDSPKVAQLVSSRDQLQTQVFLS